ncbi:N-formylglutamate amidohydrolase [Stappia stellulata]|uniref:N-formylglutamate amidohydrolase n=1 Tax=Stappia stellulata TaxID=71235 RepID=UPI001CD1DEA2|nr:N-formylglutamate amidohydrolase [Stappia stellulata]MCA1241301.1 N-formylglutamate amidohydrolase [Stappia stellulata]
MADGGRVGAEMIEIRRPARVLAPLVLDSPHSGTVYPEDFDPLQPPSRYRRAEDMYVDELFSAAPDLGMPLLAARFGRIYCDVNRAFDDLAPETLADGDELVLAPSAKARLGKGVVWTATPPDGAPLLASALPRSDYEVRLERCWRPYHAALADLLAETRGAAGGVYHLDLHSMQPVANAMHEDETGGLRPDMVLSDREGRTCSAGFIAEARRILLDLGFSVAINDPFKGAEILRQHGNPDAGVHSLQIEVNRALYMDVESFEKTADFSNTQERLTRFLRELRDWVAAR